MATKTETTVTGGGTGSGCEDCNNSSDPITLEDFADIPSEFVFKVRDKAVTHCFDIRSLHQYYEKSGKLENPLNRAVFSEETLDEFLKRIIQLGLTSESQEDQIRNDRQRQEAGESTDDDDDYEVEVIAVYHAANGHGRSVTGRHHRHGGRRHRRGGIDVGRWTNGSVASTTIINAMENGNPIARALMNYRRVYEDDDNPVSSSSPSLRSLGQQFRPNAHLHHQPQQQQHQQQQHQQQELRSTAERALPLRRNSEKVEHNNYNSHVSISSAAPAPAMRPTDDRNYLADSLQRERLLAASRPSAQSAPRASVGTRPDMFYESPPVNYNPQSHLPDLQPFYQGQFPVQFMPQATHTAPPAPTRQPEMLFHDTTNIQPQTLQQPARQNEIRQKEKETMVKETKAKETIIRVKPKSQLAQDKGHPTSTGETSGINWVLIGLLIVVGALFLAFFFPSLTSTMR